MTTQELQTRSSSIGDHADDGGFSRQVFTPLTNVIETQDALILDVEMPGVSEKGVDVTLENDVLSIEGRVEASQPSDYRAVYREVQLGDYRRVFTLNEDIDRERIAATVKDGVLHLVLPKKERAKPHRIAVQAA